MSRYTVYVYKLTIINCQFLQYVQVFNNQLFRMSHTNSLTHFSFYFFTHTATYLSCEYAGPDMFCGLFQSHASALPPFQNFFCLEDAFTLLLQGYVASQDSPRPPISYSSLPRYKAPSPFDPSN
jgi:hypothetical protein